MAHQHVTRFGSLKHYEKGGVEVINDDARNYVFSNIFEVASRAKPYEKVAVAKNLEYVLEAIRAEGTSDWQAANHDEFLLVMDGEVTVSFVEPGDAAPAPGKDGTQRLERKPTGRKMGRVHLKRGHQALLPKGAAYQFSAASPAVMIQQTIACELTREKWAQICTY